MKLANLLYLVTFILFISCSEDNNFNVPTGSPEILSISKNVTFPTDTLVLFGRYIPLQCDSCAIIFNDSVIIKKSECLFWRANSIAIIIDERLSSGHFYCVFGKDTSKTFHIQVLAYPPFDVADIKAGTFLMGSSTGFEDELPVRNVHITHNLYVGKTEVTQRLYDFIMKKNPSPIKHPNIPVYNVEFLDAIEFCNKLSEKSGLKPAYKLIDSIVLWDTTASGWRLPTEAEWEYLARAGEKNDAPYMLDDYAWYSANSGGEPKIIGQKLPNAYGIFDCLGNVSEWCWDTYSNYNPADTINPFYDTGFARVHRGGSFRDNKARVRFSSRLSDYNFVGIRLVRNN